MRQCQCKIMSVFFIFPHRGFYGNNYDIICCSFLLFFIQGFRNFTQTFIIYIFRFFLLNFLKIVFILHDIQVLKEQCYNTYVSDHLIPARLSNHQTALIRPPHLYIYIYIYDQSG
jgi:hypothetical protein